MNQAPTGELFGGGGRKKEIRRNRSSGFGYRCFVDAAKSEGVSSGKSGEKMAKFSHPTCVAGSSVATRRVLSVRFVAFAADLWSNTPVFCSNGGDVPSGWVWNEERWKQIRIEWATRGVGELWPALGEGRGGGLVLTCFDALFGGNWRRLGRPFWRAPVKGRGQFERMRRTSI